MRSMKIDHRIGSDVWQISDPATGAELGVIYNVTGDSDANAGMIVFKAFPAQGAEAHFATMGAAQEYIARAADESDAAQLAHVSPSALALINFDLIQLGPIMAELRTKTNASTLDRLGLAIANHCHLSAQGRAAWARAYQTGRTSDY